MSLIQYLTLIRWYGVILCGFMGASGAIPSYAQEAGANGVDTQNRVTEIETRISDLNGTVTELAEQFRTLHNSEDKLESAVGEVVTQGLPSVRMQLAEVGMSVANNFMAGLAVILGALTLVLGTGGVVFYRLMKNSLQGALGEKVDKLSEEMRRELKSEHEKLIEFTMRTIDEERKRGLAGTYTNLSLTFWRQYRTLDPKTTRQEYGRQLELAIHLAEMAVELTNKMPFEEHKRLVVTARANLAYHLAVRGGDDDVSKAIDLSAPLLEYSKKLRDEKVQDWYDLQETYAWVRYRSEGKVATDAKKLVGALFDAADVPEEWKKQYRPNYNM